jgi:lipid-A-disaccharide synthase
MTGSPSTTAEQSLLIIVGDLSADRHAAKIIHELKRTAPNLHVWGIGGPDMFEAGFERLYNCQDFSIIGIMEVLRQAPFLINMRKTMVKHAVKRPPTAVLLIDFGGFTIPFAGELRERFPKLPIIHFISPQVWGSRPWRIKKIARNVTKMLVIFPFEEELYRRNNVSVRFVGNPPAANLPAPDAVLPRFQFSERVGLLPSQKIVGVFPGSRRREIRVLLPLALDAMKSIFDSGRDDVQFVISQGNPELVEQINAIIAKHPCHVQVGQRIHLVSSDLNYDLMANADIVWAKSGTTALETMMFGTPMLVFYKGLWLSFLIFLLFKRVKYVSWPNLLSNSGLVPELFMLDCRAEQLVRYTNDLLDVPGLRQELRDRLLALRSQLGQGDYARNCAEEVLALIGASQESMEPSQAKV